MGRRASAGGIRGGRTFGKAAARAAVFLVAADVGYYASDSALGVYTSISYDPRNPDAWDPNAEPVFQWAGVLSDPAWRSWPPSW